MLLVSDCTKFYTINRLKHCNLFAAESPVNQRKPKFTKIIGGQPIDITAVPWQISIYSHLFDDHICGGSIIDSRRILTAAHCLIYSQPHDILARIGANSHKDGGYIRHVANIIIHERYVDGNTDNDIGIIILISPLIYGRSIQPITLPTSDYAAANGDMLLISGWGIHVDHPDAQLSNLLYAVSVPIVDQEKCALIYNRCSDSPKLITDNMFCAGLLNVGGKDACSVSVLDKVRFVLLLEI